MNATSAPADLQIDPPREVQSPTVSPRRHRRARAAGIVALTAAALVLSCTIVNGALNTSERTTTPAYGQRTAVTGGSVNVYRHGDIGPTIVMLSGARTASPAIDFAPLIRELDGYQVVVMEGFGYGYADSSTPRPRTVENITVELHEALQKTGIEGPYVLLGHSIAGIYDLYYANSYPDEVSAVIGIDASVPGQMNGMAGQANPILGLVSTTGLLRVASSLAPSLVLPDGDAYTAAEMDQMRLMINWNWANPALFDEAKQSAHNFAAVQEMSYPAGMPVLSFIKTEGNQPRWEALHQTQLNDRPFGELVALDGGHYLHWTQSAILAADIRSFLTDAGVTR